MALDAAFVIRVASAALFALVGTFAIVVGRSRLHAVALGAFLLAVAGQVVLSNLNDLLLLPLALVLGGLAGLLVAATAVPRPVGPLLAGTAVAGLAAGLLVFQDGVDTLNFATRLGSARAFLLAGGVAVYVTGIGAAALAVALAVARDPPSDDAAWVRSGAVALVVPLFTVFGLPRIGPDTLATSGATFAAVLILTVASSALWLVAAARSRARAPALVAILWAAIGFAGYAYLALLRATGTPDPGGSNDPWGLNGVIRLASWAFLVHAILKADLLGVKLPRLAVARGPLAAGALATLFIVAQVAQNFLSDAYGLVMGGVVAGAFLFMAAPLQRAFERIGGSADRVEPPARGVAIPALSHEAAYKAAVRIAMRAGMTREDELELARVAESHGIGPVRAHELRDEAEREVRAKEAS